MLFGERHRFSRTLRHGVSLVLAAARRHRASCSGNASASRRPSLLVAAVLAGAARALTSAAAAPGFWAFIWSLITAAALAFIAVIIFCLGLSAIFVSLHYLFGFEIDAALYGHFWSIGLGFVGPLFALSLIPIAFPTDDTPEGADLVLSGVRTLSDFVAVPLLATYALILHAYALKIVATGELPNNQIGWMVLSFGLCVLALRIVVHPLREVARAPTRLFLDWWAVPLVVPLALLVTASGCGSPLTG